MRKMKLLCGIALIVALLCGCSVFDISAGKGNAREAVKDSINNIQRLVTPTDVPEAEQ